MYYQEKCIETAVKTAIVKWQLSEHGGDAEKTGYDHIVDEVMKQIRHRDELEVNHG